MTSIQLLNQKSRDYQILHTGWCLPNFLEKCVLS